MEKNILNNIKVILPPHLFKSDMKEYSINEVNKKYTNFCCEKYGYILEILDISWMNDEIIISPVTSLAEVFLSIKANFYKPKVGDIHKGIIIKKSNIGSIVMIYETVPIFISKNTITNFDELEIGETVNIKIINFQYYENSFSTFGIFL